MTNSLLRVFSFVVFILLAMNLKGQVRAFPGAEGHGAYVTGGRGGVVYEVTNLNDSGTGSFRAAITASGTRTIIFRVSGMIELKSNMTIKNGDVTIAGQTAPGQGICLKNYPLVVDADNVIIRFIRSRLGDEMDVESDAMWGRRHKDIVIDHCTMSWSVDEAGSFYDNENFTMQWCILSESLYHSVHEKGNHGYGGIWGGMKASFHHNLLAHHTSRNPRFCGSRYHGVPENEIVDFRNNVIYNWGGNSAYGGEQGNQNMVNNYYKSGPGTKSSVKKRIVNPSDASTNDPMSQWYVEGNYVEGFPEVTADNWNNGVQPDNSISLDRLRVYEPFPTGDIITQTAEEAYEDVLKYAGAACPYRDEIDQRIVEETRTGTTHFGGYYGASSGIIDTPSDAGGWVDLVSGEPPVDDDHDGMADDWEDANWLDKTDPDDGNSYNHDGYTNLEVYLNSLIVYDETPQSTMELTVKTEDFRVTPNPADDRINIMFQSASSSQSSVFITDLSGRIVIREQIASGSGKYTLSVNTAALPEGLYLVGVRNENNFFSKKVTVRH